MPERAVPRQFTVNKKTTRWACASQTRVGLTVLLAALSAPAEGTSTPPTPEIPLAPLVPYLPPVPDQAFLWTGTVTLSLNYTADFKGQNLTTQSSSGSVTREKRGHEEMQATLKLVDVALKDCDWKCSPNVGSVQFNSYFIERFIAQTNELCDKNWIKAVRISTQEHFTLGADDQQGQTTWNLTATDLTPRLEWNSVKQVWMLWLTTQPLMTPLRFYSKAEGVDCSGSHPEAPIQQLLESPVPIPSVIELKKQVMTFQNTLSGQALIPALGLDGQQYPLKVNYQFRLVPVNTR